MVRVMCLPWATINDFKFLKRTIPAMLPKVIDATLVLLDAREDCEQILNRYKNCYVRRTSPFGCFISIFPKNKLFSLSLI